jgi:hypothetical protein
MGLIRKFPIGEWPAVIKRSYRAFKRFETIVSDYERVSPPSRPPSDQLSVRRESRLQIADCRLQIPAPTPAQKERP